MTTCTRRPRTAKEWGSPLVVSSFDVAAAFDNLTQVERAIGGSRRADLAVLRDRVGMRDKPRIGPVEGVWQCVAKGFRHSAARSPDAWSDTIASPALVRTRMQSSGAP